MRGGDQNRGSFVKGTPVLRSESFFELPIYPVTFVQASKLSHRDFIPLYVSISVDVQLPTFTVKSMTVDNWHSNPLSIRIDDLISLSVGSFSGWSRTIYVSSYFTVLSFRLLGVVYGLQMDIHRVIRVHLSAFPSINPSRLHEYFIHQSHGCLNSGRTSRLRWYSGYLQKPYVLVSIGLRKIQAKFYNGTSQLRQD